MPFPHHARPPSLNSDPSLRHYFLLHPSLLFSRSYQPLLISHLTTVISYVIATLYRRSVCRQKRYYSLFDI